MPVSGSVRVVSCRRAGGLIPKRPAGLRAAVVALQPGSSMAWHSTHDREELLIVLTGRVVLEVASSRGRCRRVVLAVGRAAVLSTHTEHRVINRSRQRATYVYVTAPVAPRLSVR